MADLSMMALKYFARFKTEYEAFVPICHKLDKVSKFGFKDIGPQWMDIGGSSNID